MELLSIIKHIGMTFAIGSSTFAMIFYFLSLEDGVIDQSERHFMHTVYFVLRIGLAILVPWELGIMGYALLAQGDWHAYTIEATNWFRIILLGIIIINAALMTKHAMPMWLGPGLAGGSWYFYYFVSITPKIFNVAFLLCLYVVFVVTFVTALRLIRRIYIEKKPIF